MPNHCENDLRVEATSEQELRDFMAAVRSEEVEGESSPFSLNKIIPYPEHFAKADKASADWEKANPLGDWKHRPKDGFNQGGYEWCNANWGTKWDAYDFGQTEEEIHPEWKEFAVTFHFSTAWAPPKPVIEAAAKRWPNLTFDLRYFEGGSGFNGWLECKDGKVTNDKSGDYFGNRGG